MKVLHVITGLGDGGAEAVLYRLCLFDKENQHIVVSLMDEGKYGALLAQAGITVECLGLSSFKAIVNTVIKLRKLIKAHRPDVVQTWMYHADLIGGVVARLAGIKNIVWGVHHTTLVKGESKRSTILIAKLNAFLSRFVPKKIIYCAQKSRDVQESIGFSHTKGVVVPNGYNISDFQPSDEARSKFRKDLGVDDDVFLIGHVGRYDPQKDHANLIDALGLVRNAGYNLKLVLIGRDLDANNQSLLNHIHDNQLTEAVVLLGQRTDIPVVMNGLDLHVLSSSFGEAFPNVLAEAMACGTPCVTTDVGDAALIVGETGWVVLPKDPQALADAVMQALDVKQTNHQAWLERKASCRNRIVENFSIEKMVASYRQVWES